MSFIWKADKPLRTPEDVTRVVATVAITRGLDEFAAVLALMCIATESGFWCPWNAKAAGSNSYPYDSQSDDGRSVGYFQQQTGPNGEPWWGTVAEEMDLHASCHSFMSRLPANYRDCSNDPHAAGELVADVQGCADYARGRYAEQWQSAWGLLHSVFGNSILSAPSGTGPLPEPPPREVKPMASSSRPAYNEFPVWSPNNESRQGQAIDLFLIHTQEGGGGDAAAEDLAHYLADPNSQVSYHYTVSQASDGGVTVVDCVDTDVASWSVGDANYRSINLCFAGSSVDWTRDQWLEQSSAIDVAAYLAIQDVAKYPSLASAFIGVGGDYHPDIKSGIADHRYVTDVLQWGTHTDVGSNFPADVFTARLAYWAGGGESQAPPPVAAPPAPPVPSFDDWLQSATELELLRYIAEQLGPGNAAWASAGQTLRDKVWNEPA